MNPLDMSPPWKEKRRIILVVGETHAGKTTSGEVLYQVIPGSTRLALVYPVMNAVCALYGVSHAYFHKNKDKEMLGRHSITLRQAAINMIRSYVVPFYGEEFLAFRAYQDFMIRRKASVGIFDTVGQLPELQYLREQNVNLDVLHITGYAREYWDGYRRRWQEEDFEGLPYYRVQNTGSRNDLILKVHTYAKSFIKVS